VITLAEEGSKLWWVLGALLILIGVFYIASTSSSSFGGRGIFQYFGAKYAAPAPVSPVSGGAGAGKPAGAGFDIWDYWWLILIPLILGLIWKRGAIGRGLGAGWNRVKGAFSPQGIALDIVPGQQQIPFNDQTVLEARLTKNGNPMWKLPGRKITIAFTQPPPAGTFITDGHRRVDSINGFLEVPLANGGIARAALHSGDERGTAKFKASWRTVLYSSGHVLTGHVIYSPEKEVQIGPVPAPPQPVGNVLVFVPENNVDTLAPFDPAHPLVSLALTATLTRGANPFPNQDLRFYMRSFAPQGGQPLAPGAVTEAEISGGGHAVSLVYDPAAPNSPNSYLVMQTNNEGKTSITLKPSVTRGSVIVCAEYAGLQPECVTIGIGMQPPQPHQQDYLIIAYTSDVSARAGGFVFAKANVKLNGADFDEPLVFKISDDGGTGAHLADASGNRVPELTVQDRDPVDKLYLARVKAVDRPGRVTYDVSLADAAKQARPAQGILNLTIDTSQFIQRTEAVPPELTAQGEICKISVYLAGRDISGKDIEFELLPPDISARLLDLQDTEQIKISAKTDAQGVAIARLRAGAVSGDVKVKAALAPSGSSAVIDIKINISTSALVPVPPKVISPRVVPGSGEPVLLGPGAQAPLLLPPGQEFQLIIVCSYVPSEANEPWHTRIATALLRTVQGNPVPGKKIAFYIEERKGTDAALVDGEGKPSNRVVAVTGDNGAASVKLLAGKESGTFFIRAVFTENKGVYNRSPIDLELRKPPAINRAEGGLRDTGPKFLLDVQAAPPVLGSSGTSWVIAQLSSAAGEPVSGYDIDFAFARTQGNIDISFIGQKPNVHVFRVRTDGSGLAAAGLSLSGLPGKVRVRAILAVETNVHGFAEIELRTVPALPVQGNVLQLPPGRGVSIEVLPNPASLQIGSLALVRARVLRDGRPLPKADMNRLTFKMTAGPPGCSLISFRHEEKRTARKHGEKIDGSISQPKEGVFSQVRFTAGAQPGRAVVRVEWHSGDKGEIKGDYVFQDVVFDIVK